MKCVYCKQGQMICIKYSGEACKNIYRHELPGEIMRCDRCMLNNIYVVDRVKFNDKINLPGNKQYEQLDLFDNKSMIGC